MFFFFLFLRTLPNFFPSVISLHLSIHWTCSRSPSLLPSGYWPFLPGLTAQPGTALQCDPGQIHLICLYCNCLICKMGTILASFSQGCRGGWTNEDRQSTRARNLFAALRARGVALTPLGVGIGAPSWCRGRVQAPWGRSVITLVSLYLFIPAPRTALDSHKRCWVCICTLNR